MRSVPGWDRYFMEIAKTVASRSKDPDTQVGAVLVDTDNHVIGTGYNGFSPGIPDSDTLWKRPTKYDYVVHAEANCLLHSVQKPRNAKIYTTMYPCKDCAKLLAASGVKEIVFLDDKYESGIASELILSAGIKIWKLK